MVDKLTAEATKLHHIHIWYTTARVHNNRREGEYPTSMVWPNALHKVMT